MQHHLLHTQINIIRYNDITIEININVFANQLIEWQLVLALNLLG
jgi:hypothetical protein